MPLGYQPVVPILFSDHCPVDAFQARTRQPSEAQLHAAFLHQTQACIACWQVLKCAIDTSIGVMGEECYLLVQLCLSHHGIAEDFRRFDWLLRGCHIHAELLGVASRTGRCQRAGACAQLLLSCKALDRCSQP